RWILLRLCGGADQKQQQRRQRPKHAHPPVRPLRPHFPQSLAPRRRPLRPSRLRLSHSALRSLQQQKISGRARMGLRTTIAALIALLALGANAATAQDWPTKPVRIITGFAAGGIGDLGARLLAEHISRTAGQQAVVENRTGAAGTLGMDVVAKAPPDGTTLGLALNGNLVINPFIQKS